MCRAPIFDVPKVRPLPEDVRFEIMLQSQALLDMDTPEAWHESGERRPFLWTELRRFHQVDLPRCLANSPAFEPGLYHALIAIDGLSRPGRETRGDHLGKRKINALLSRFSDQSLT
jgi:hypothetical protein